MKKLRLKALDLGAKELLSREQLRNILGGDGSDDGGSGPTNCGMTPTIACSGKSSGDQCCWYTNQTVYYGICRSYAPTYVLRCSDLN
ncbi:hypothetical protein CLV59_108140 [Chitinophaga dinghuensis]|uniref:Natural product n=1 Tax=Chitinophaga dinghuensis TaxID=1539050 RepID=A0A327VMR7_9BACT|nr:hypothetical protein [Chitinophaga dinghuensis]RAJ76621.1 hypothetical protein CLV59_108140 [Chitinophaga dinghuensis]